MVSSICCATGCYSNMWLRLCFGSPGALAWRPILAIPLGLMIGWHRRSEMALNPLVQVFRPISPLAWIPIAILWFGVGDSAAIFLIFLGCFFPLLLTAINAVRNIPTVYINAGRNFGLSPTELVYRVLYPAVVPQL